MLEVPLCFVHLVIEHNNQNRFQHVDMQTDAKSILNSSNHAWELEIINLREILVKLHI